MNIIQKCNAYKIKDSRGEETLEVEISTAKCTSWAAVPAGKSTGSREVVALPTGGAIEKVNKIIAPEIIGKEVNFKQIDKLLLSLDGTENKSNLGANSILGVSIAILKLEAKIAQMPLWKYIQSCGYPTSTVFKSGVFPRLFVNVLNGGVHAGFRLSIQEHMFVLGNGQNIAGPIRQMQTLFEQLEKKLISDGWDFVMGDEGGFSIATADVEEPFRILSALHNKIAIDVAAGEFYKNGKYLVGEKEYSSEELRGLYEDLIKKYPLVSIEDPFAENDFEGFKNLVTSVGVLPLQREVLVVGDDLTTTNPKMIEKSINEKMLNTVLVKPNQIGTVSETLEAIEMTHKAGLKTIISHRSGETMDSFIADLAVGVGAYGLKAGTMHQAERKEKYDRLLEIEKEMAE